MTHTPAITRDLRLVATAHQELESLRDLHSGAGLSDAELIDVANVLNNAASRLLDMFVTRARQSGTTWQTVAEQLDVSRQAAQQRFGGRAPR